MSIRSFLAGVAGCAALLTITAAPARAETTDGGADGGAEDAVVADAATDGPVPDAAEPDAAAADGETIADAADATAADAAAGSDSGAPTDGGAAAADARKSDGSADTGPAPSYEDDGCSIGRRPGRSGLPGGLLLGLSSTAVVLRLRRQKRLG
jgi:hypothetical protein